ncbi:MAG: HAD family phosphatase, partial [Methylobacteriaceae bacterium]|nr:HAD family phosphatase [Methylobacteriaceae bacterium]
EAVLFDMDGLLVDTESVYRDAILAEAEARGSPMPLSLFLQMVGLPAHACDDLATSHFGAEVDLAVYNSDVDARVKERLDAGVALKPGVIELLDLLDELNMPRAIVTSSSHATVEAHLGRSGIVPRFNAVIARGDYTRGKPHPDPFLRAAGMLQRNPTHCLVLEDSHNGIRAAHAAGMIAIMVPDLLEPTEEIHGLCLAVAETLHDVRDGLLRWRGSQRR